jgi:hypothetical protein
MNLRLPLTAVFALLALSFVACGKNEASVDIAKEKAAGEIAAKEKETLETAIDAYVYAYPLVTMEYTRRALTNTEKPEGTKAPMGQFVRMREYPNASFKDVTAPNADTLYTQAWFDVSKEPWIVSFPDMKGRYALFPMLSGWTDVFQVPGKRTTGTGAQKYAITGPGWSGTLPAGVTEYKSPTGMVWLLGRIYCTGTPQDYKAVHELQDKITAVPLSSYGKAYTPEPGSVDASLDSKKSVRDRVHELEGNAYFKLFAELLKTNPPAANDAPLVATLAKIGIVPGQDFDAWKLGAAIAKAVAGAPKPAQETILGHLKEAGTFENGWIFTTKTGVYGTDYLQRALITAIGLGANRPQDAVYPTSEADSDGKSYSGANKYVMHFNKDEMPPVDGFWSLTMYNAEYFFVENPLNRYNVSSRSKFKTNPDGSVDVYVQNESPGKDKEANWLPAPKDKFILMLRLYWPKEKAPSIIDGSWKIPPVTIAAASDQTKEKPGTN